MWVLDLAFIFSAVLAAVLGRYTIYLLVIFSLLPLIFSGLKQLLGRLKLIPVAAAIVTLAYFLLNLIYLYFYTGLPSGQTAPPNPSFEFYAVGVLVLVLSTSRGLMMVNASATTKECLPFALLATFLVLTVYAVVDPTGDGRVQAETPWPFVPALLFTTWAFLSLLDWKHLPPKSRLVRLGGLSLSILVVNGYTGSRGIGIAQFSMLFVMGVASLLPRFVGALPKLREIGAAVIVGLALFGVHQLATSGGAFHRGQHIFNLVNQYLQSAEKYVAPLFATPVEAKAAEMIAEAPVAQANASQPVSTALSEDASISVRFEMWEVSIEHIWQAPIFGHGAMSLKPIIQDQFGHQHTHNQYLSWLVTGGAFLLSIGLLFLTVPYLATQCLPPADRLIVLLATAGLWGISMMFDSFLSLKFFFHYYCALIGIITALSVSRRSNR